MKKFTVEQLVLFCREKEVEYRKLQLARHEMAAGWRSGTDAEYKAAAKMSGCRFIGAATRLAIARRDDKIAAKYSADADMYAAIREQLMSVEKEAR